MLKQVFADTPEVFSIHEGLVFSMSPDLSQVGELREENTLEVIHFLSVSPVHTVVMRNFICRT